MSVKEGVVLSYYLLIVVRGLYVRTCDVCDVKNNGSNIVGTFGVNNQFVTSYKQAAAIKDKARVFETFFKGLY